MQIMTFDQLEGATIVANDGAFLGKITVNSIDPESITNPIGIYGSAISALSILNQIGQYGSEISSKSSFNPITSTPPRILMSGQFVAYLTANPLMTPGIDPGALIDWLQS